ncbi:MAG: ATP-binding cassette domain-containing protein [Selenomonas sp.]|uniref:amino acid ABC transporter ATP-binding/permease protein n=1 Tax=Selenomonas sp. TaxID=2053611 RepID=UPI0025E334C6|nr:ATP-binding cassette domain-containing protein [Selenomonas sp.]MCR5439869.1 ATP-binding cassette domain-containing protein [Selenomonas sp.]
MISHPSFLPKLVKLPRFTTLLSSTLAALAAAICAIGLMGTAAWLISSAALHPPLATLTLAITAVRTFGIGRAGFRYLERYLSHKLAFHSFTKLQLFLYDLAAAALPLREGLIAQGQWLQALTTGCGTLRDFYLRGLLPPIINLLLLIAISAGLYPLVGKLALLLLPLFLLHLLLPYWAAVLPTPTAGTYRTLLSDSVNGRDELAAAGSWAAFLPHLDQQAKSLNLQQQQESAKDYRTDFLLQLLDALVFLLLLAGLAQCVLHNASLSFIDLSLWLMILLAAMQELQPLAKAARTIQRSQQAAQVILTKPLPQTPAESTAPIDKSNSLLTIQQIDFGYQPAIPILQGLSFCIARGQHTAIVGDSGSGKTTLAGLICGFWPADSGSIHLTGQISANLQTSFLFTGTIRDNFQRLIPGISNAAILHCLKIAQLDRWLKAQPAGLDTCLIADAQNLSGGQRNRLLTALALAKPGELLILDEPTAGLDKKTASALLTELLIELDKQQRTLLLITHDSPAAARMNQVIHL